MERTPAGSPAHSFRSGGQHPEEPVAMHLSAQRSNSCLWTLSLLSEFTPEFSCFRVFPGLFEGLYEVACMG
jgi:hypothetical protein